MSAELENKSETSGPPTPANGGATVTDARATAGESPLRRFVRRFRSDRWGVVWLCFLILVGLLTLLAPLIATHDPNAQNTYHKFAPMSGEHLLGTDELGRDYFSRLVYASRPTLLTGVAATMLGLLVGLPTGLLAGYFRGWADSVLGRITDAFIAIPGLLFAMALVAVMGQNIRTLIIALGVANAPRFFRVARGVAIGIRQETYVEAARSLGIGAGHIIRKHLLPNMASPLIVQISMTVGFSILMEAGLSYLGLGVQPPAASWGSMLKNGTAYASESIWLVLLPGIAILLVVLAFNSLGDAVRDSLGKEARTFS